MLFPILCNVVAGVIAKWQVLQPLQGILKSEIRALQSSSNPPLLWKRFVDDTFVIINKAHKEEFLTHINSVDNNIQFTAEEPGPDGSLPFLDILISPDEDGRLVISVYRKPTHMDQYLQWDSHHPISAKYRVVGTLYHRAKTISS